MALAGGPVVAGEYEDGVVELADSLQLGPDAGHALVDGLHHGGVHLHIAGHHPALALRVAVPSRHVFLGLEVPGWEFGVRRHDSEFDLAG